MVFQKWAACADLCVFNKYKLTWARCSINISEDYMIFGDVCTWSSRVRHIFHARCCVHAACVCIYFVNKNIFYYIISWWKLVGRRDSHTFAPSISDIYIYFAYTHTHTIFETETTRLPDIPISSVKCAPFGVSMRSYFRVHILSLYFALAKLGNRYNRKIRNKLISHCPLGYPTQPHRTGINFYHQSNEIQLKSFSSLFSLEVPSAGQYL